MYIQTGTAGNDLLRGTDNRDLLKGLAGNDTLVGNKGDDTMLGGTGNDVMVWNNGDNSDIMNGSQGYDTAVVNGAVSDGDQFTLKRRGATAIFKRTNLVPFQLTVSHTEKFKISGLGGNDELFVGNLDHTPVKFVEFNGGGGNDILDAEDTSTQILAFGGNGNDELVSGTADDTLVGGNGHDDIEGEQGSDTMIGGRGNDTLGWDDGDGSDRIRGNAGIDTVEVEGSLTEGDYFTLKQRGQLAIFDRINLGPFTLTVDTAEIFDIDGAAGNDTLVVGNLNKTDVDRIEFLGRSGNDLLNARSSRTPVNASGGVGNDTLVGSQYDDWLAGNSGADRLLGNRGEDTLKGGSCDDTLQGGGGKDQLTGGRGADIFWLTHRSIDTITDFNAREGDRLRISASLLGYYAGGKGLQFNRNSDLLTVDGVAIAEIQDPIGFNLSYVDIV